LLPFSPAPPWFNCSRPRGSTYARASST
jgi:hypothetical protein